MKLLIDKIKLKLLLEEKRDFVGNKIEGIDTFLAGLFFLLSLLCSDYHDIGPVNGVVIKTLAFVIGLSASLYGIKKICVSIIYKYDHKILYHDIENLNEITHPFSIVAIKDTFNEFSNRFLLYYDEAWKCWFFFSFKTIETQNEENIKTRLSNLLHIEKKNIDLQYKLERIQPKYSIKDNINKVYLHRLYQGYISDFPEVYKNNQFEINGVKFKWMTISEMENDSTIKKINQDVVSMVKDKIV
jgi:hypothetical protein